MNKIITSLKKIGLLPVYFFCFSSSAIAQDSGFADDFTVNSTAFSAGTFSNSSGDWQISEIPEGLRLETAAADASVAGSLFIQSIEPSDSYGIDVTFDSSSDYTGSATIFLESRIYSDTADPTDLNGDIEMQLTYDRYDDGRYAVFYCLQRQVDGAEEPLGEFGSEFCDRLTEGTGVDGVRRALDINIDRANSSVTVSFGETSKLIGLPGTIYPPALSYKRIQLYMNNESVGRSIAKLHEIRFDSKTLELASNPIALDRYLPANDVDGNQRTISHTPGTLTLTARATEENRFRNRLYLQAPTNYLESTFTLSDASTFGNNGRVRGQIEMSLYNDQADGGINDREGDVETFIEVQLGANGLASVEYCLQRQDNADASSRSGLLNDGDDCALLPIRPSLGVPIRVSIDFDPDTGTVTYRADQYIAVHTLSGPFYTHSEEYAGIAAAPSELSDVVLEIDELRSSPSALTLSEMASGVAAPAAFPAPVTEVQPADSTIRFPLAEAQPLDFVDDFSTASYSFAFDYGTDRTNPGITVVDGSIQLEAVQSDPDNCCGDTYIRVQESTDLLAARVSLSSETVLPVEDDADARIRLQGIFWNDTQNGGFDDRGGDIYAQLRLRLREDGRREASVCLDRRNGSGGNESFDIFNGENCQTFTGIPELDTEYDMSIELDRVNAKLRMTFDAELIEVDVPGSIYQAAVDEKSVQVQHQGTSGRAVGRVYSITTDSGTRSVADGSLLIAPYRPLYSIRYEGRSVDIVDGRLRFEFDSAIGDGNRPRFISRSPSEYVAALLELSSESAANAGNISIGLGGQFYNDIMDSGIGDGNSEGEVYSILNLSATGQGESFIEYCVIRSNNADFSDTTNLVATTEGECPRFTTPLMLDTPVMAVIALDREKGALTFTAGDETIEYTIPTGIFISNTYFNGIRANASDGGRLIAYADDLAFSATPVPLDQSSTLIAGAQNGLDSGDTTGGSSASGGSGGCSIASAHSGLSAPYFLIVLMGLLRIRKTRKPTR